MTKISKWYYVFTNPNPAGLLSKFLSGSCQSNSVQWKGSLSLKKQVLVKTHFIRIMSKQMRKHVMS